MPPFAFVSSGQRCGGVAARPDPALVLLLSFNRYHSCSLAGFLFD
jgi:hypothetical protein